MKLDHLLNQPSIYLMSSITWFLSVCQPFVLGLLMGLLFNPGFKCLHVYKLFSLAVDVLWQHDERDGSRQAGRRFSHRANTGKYLFIFFVRVYLFQVIIYTIITTIMMAILLELFFFSGLELQLLFLLLIFASPVLMCVCVLWFTSIQHRNIFYTNGSWFVIIFQVATSFLFKNK